MPRLTDSLQARIRRALPFVLIASVGIFGCDPDEETETAGDGGTGHSHTDGGHETGAMANCEVEERDDDFMTGMIKDGDKARITIMDAVPATPIRADNAWTLMITDLADAPLEGVDVSIRPWMPDHGHGTPVEAEITDLGGGEYHFEPVNLFMAGLWEIHLELALDDASTDEIMFAVCVE